MWEYQPGKEKLWENGCGPSQYVKLYMCSGARHAHQHEVEAELVNPLSDTGRQLECWLLGGADWASQCHQFWVTIRGHNEVHITG